MTRRETDAISMEKYLHVCVPELDDELIALEDRVARGARTRILRKRDVLELITIGCETCGAFNSPPSVPGSVAQIVEAEKRKNIPSFVRRGRELELSVCAAAAVMKTVSHGTGVRPWYGWGVAEVLAASLWSALSFLPACEGPKLEALRRLMVRTARDRILVASLRARKRKVVRSSEGVASDNDESEDGRSEVRKAVCVLEWNAMVDQEEIDVLRWVIAGVCASLDRRLELLSPEIRAIAAGFEIGALMRAPPAQRHRDYAVGGLTDDTCLCLSQVLEALGEYRMKMTMSFEGAPIDSVALVFPLLSALSAGEATGPGANLSRPLSEWGARALLERSLLNICLQGGKAHE